jgi:hypothetical protein
LPLSRTQNCQGIFYEYNCTKDFWLFLSSIKLAVQTTTIDVWEDFLKLQISANTKRTDASVLADFLRDWQLVLPILSKFKSFLYYLSLKRWGRCADGAAVLADLV